MKIRFLKDYKVQAENSPFYKAGEVYDLPELSANHFLRKGRAEIVQPMIELIPVPEVAEAIKKTESKVIGARGGDPVKRFSKAQQSFRKKAIKGEK